MNYSPPVSLTVMKAMEGFLNGASLSRLSLRISLAAVVFSLLLFCVITE